MLKYYDNQEKFRYILRYFHEHVLIFVLNIIYWLCKFIKFKPTLKIEFYERLDKGVISLLFVLKPFYFLI